MQKELRRVLDIDRALFLRESPYGGSKNMLSSRLISHIAMPDERRSIARIASFHSIRTFAAYGTYRVAIHSNVIAAKIYMSY